MLEAFERLGVPADYADAELPAIYEPACYLRDLHPAHDVVASGKKVSGNVQYRRRDAVVQHGSLTYSVEAESHLAVFADPGVSTGVSTEEFRECVTGIDEHADASRAEAVDALAVALGEWADADAGDWTGEETGPVRNPIALARAREKW